MDCPCWNVEESQKNGMSPYNQTLPLHMIHCHMSNMYSVYDVGGMSKEQKQSRQYFVTSKEKVYITPSTIGSGLLNPPNYKTAYSTPWTFQNRPNNPPWRFWRVVLSFSFFIYFSWIFEKPLQITKKIQKLKIKFYWILHE